MTGMEVSAAAERTALEITSVWESISVGLSLMAIVFLVLFFLYGCLRIFSFAVGKAGKSQN